MLRDPDTAWRSVCPCEPQLWRMQRRRMSLSVSTLESASSLSRNCIYGIAKLSFLLEPWSRAVGGNGVARGPKPSGGGSVSASHVVRKRRVCPVWLMFVHAKAASHLVWRLRVGGKEQV